MIKVGGPTLMIAALALAVAACGGGESALVATPSPAQTQDVIEVPESAQMAPPGATPRTIDGQRPPSFAETIATPDLRNAVSPEEAEELLLQVPGVGDVLRAVAGGDVDALLGLIDWRPMPCDIPHGETL